MYARSATHAGCLRWPLNRQAHHWNAAGACLYDLCCCNNVAHVLLRGDRDIRPVHRQISWLQPRLRQFFWSQQALRKRKRRQAARLSGLSRVNAQDHQHRACNQHTLCQ